MIEQAIRQIEKGENKIYIGNEQQKDVFELMIFKSSLMEYKMHQRAKDKEPLGG